MRKHRGLLQPAVLLDGLWKAIGLALVGLIVLNLLAAAVLELHHLLKPPPVVARSDLVARYFRAEERLRLTWKPYVYWRAEPISGDCINVGADGLRKTWSAGLPSAGRPVARVFVFGGSTVFGLGTCDDHTVPSELAKALAAAGLRNVEVVNFGQLGYVSTQEVLNLLWSVRRGNVPDVAVFCDGFNDVASAYQNGVAGVTENEANRAAEFNALNLTLYPSAVFDHTLRAELQEWPVIHLARKILRRLGFPLPEPGSRGIRMSWDVSFAGPRERKLADQVVRVYAANARLAAGVSHEMGFTTLFYWQPTAYGSQTTPLNLPLGNESPPEFQSLLREAYADADGLARSRADGFTLTDLGAALNREPASCFLDDVHLDAHCNRVIARIIASDVSRALRHQSAPSPAGSRP